MQNTLKQNEFKQIGGKKLGIGSFGCIVTPPIKCPKTPSKYLTQKYVSKLLFQKLGKTDRKDLHTELKVYEKIKEIDNGNNFFIYPMDICELKNIPHNRKDVKEIKYLSSKYSFKSNISDILKKSHKKSYSNNSYNSYDSDNDIEYKYIIDKNKIIRIRDNDTKCYIDKSLKPINIIYRNVGYSLKDILSLSKFKRYRKYYKQNYIQIFHKILCCLALLHTNKIVHSDIKPDNIMTQLPNKNTLKNNTNSQSKSHTKSRDKSIKNNKNNKIDIDLIRLIDFGFSYIVNRHSIYTESRILYYQGTPFYISIDLIIAKYIKENRIRYLYNELEKIKYEYHKYNIDKYISPLKISIITELIIIISDLMKSGLYENKFMAPNNGFCYLSDIYSLGISMAEYIELLNIKPSNEIKDLILQMTTLNPMLRISAIDALKHPAFAHIINESSIEISKLTSENLISLLSNIKN